MKIKQLIAKKLKYLLDLLPYILIILGIYSLIVVYNGHTESFTIYSDTLFNKDNNLLLGDIYSPKQNIGLGNKSYDNSKDYYEKNYKDKIISENSVILDDKILNNKMNKEPLTIKEKLVSNPDNNNCIPFEMCNSFYGRLK